LQNKLFVFLKLDSLFLFVIASLLFLNWNLIWVACCFFFWLFWQLKCLIAEVHAVWYCDIKVWDCQFKFLCYVSPKFYR